MIVFDLVCGSAHVFEAWFGSSADFDDQSARALIACPICSDVAVTKAVMAPAVAAKGNSRRAAAAAQDLAELLAVQRRMEAASDYVGSAFAIEARALHDGDTPARSIYGETTIAEARALVEDGIPVMPLPFRPLICSDA